MPLTSDQRRAADYIGHIVQMPDGRWTGYLTDRCGSTLLLQGAAGERAGAQQLQLAATFGETPDQARLRREAKR